MTAITLHGNEIHTNGSLPQVGSLAPDFVLVNKDLEEVKLTDFNGMKTLMNIVPSLDTPVCALSTKKFNDAATKHKDTSVLIISADLPFAMTRFCSKETLKNITALSMMRTRDFARDYGVLIEDGPLAGITARAVVVLDPGSRVLHAQLVGEISDEPDYDAALAAL